MRATCASSTISGRWPPRLTIASSWCTARDTWRTCARMPWSRSSSPWWNRRRIWRALN